MSFQAYLDNIAAKTGKSAADFKAMAIEPGFATPVGLAKGIKATRITDWLKADFDPGHGHEVAIVALLNGKKE